MVLCYSLTVPGGFSPLLNLPTSSCFLLPLHSQVGIAILLRVRSRSAFKEISNHQHLFLARPTQSGGERSEDNSGGVLWLGQKEYFLKIHVY